MCQYLAELCSLLVEDTFGAFFAHIFSALTTYGRLEATQLARKCRLPGRQIRYGLSVLVQAQLVYHHTSSDQRTSYETNLLAAYDLVRSGKIVSLANENLGEDAALVLAHILSVGQVTVKDVHRVWRQSQGGHKLQNGGISQQHSMIDDGGAQPQLRTTKQPGPMNLSEVLKRLVQNGYVARLRRAHFHTAADNAYDAQNHLLSLDNGVTVKSGKGQDVMDGKLWEEMASRNDASISLADVIHGNKTSSKRPAADDSDGAMRKKTKLTNGTSSGSLDAASIGVAWPDAITEPFVIRVNLNKVAALLRNRRLTDLVRKTLGRSAAQVYMTVLQQSTLLPHVSQGRSEPAPEDEDLRRNSGPEDRDTDASTYLIDKDSLLMALDTQHQQDDNEDGALPSHVYVNDYANGYVNGYVNGSHSTEVLQTVTTHDVERRLSILAQPPYQFVVHDPNSFKWTIDFRKLASQLRREEAMRLAKSRLDGAALRLLRVLLDCGKLDEKTLQEKSLLSAKDLRQCLAKLKKTGFIGLQEVPKEPQRQPLRNIYLWFYDSDRVRRMLLVDLYKAMSRLFRRLKVERNKVGALLEKAERIDVKGKEEKFLARRELEVLDSWRRKEEWLLGEVERLDDSVAILRDI